MSVATVPVLAHGGVEGALPMPFSLFLYAMGALVLVAYLAVRFRPADVLAWPSGRVLPSWAQVGCRIGAVLLSALGLLGWAVVLTAALFGNASPATNIAWLALGTGFLALFPLLSVLFGDVWRAVSPYRTVGRLLARLAPEDAEPPPWSAWLAPLAVLSLAWFLLCREVVDEPRGLGWWLLVYSLVVLGGAARWGMRWVDQVEGFGVLFGLFASLAVLRQVEVEGEPGRRQVVAGWPLVGARGIEPTAPAAAVLAVAAAIVLFDGLVLSDPWLDLVRSAEGFGWVLAHTVGLVFVALLVAVVVLGAARLMATDQAPDDLAVALLPAFVAVVAGTTVAHDLPAVLVDGQFLPILASDPYGQGWDLFGTSSNSPNFEILSAAAFAWLESAAVALGAVGSVLVGHDLLVRRDGVGPLSRSLFVVSVVVALVAIVGIALILGQGGE